jgi:hypothetical protein
MSASNVGQIGAAADVEQFAKALSMLAGADLPSGLGMDCTTRRKSTIAPRVCGSVVGLVSVHLSGSSSPTIQSLSVGFERFDCLLILVSYRFERVSRSIAGGEGVGGCAARGAYNALRRTKLIHIALGLMGGPSVEIKAEASPTRIGFRPTKKERGAA